MRQRISFLRRVIRGCLILVLVILVLIGGFVMWKWHTVVAWIENMRAILDAPQYLEGLNKPGDILGYLLEHRTDTALVVYTVDEAGDPVQGDQAIFHNADEPMPLASTMKIVVLAAYARAVEQGQLVPDELIRVEDWERYYLPGTDGGAHGRALIDLKIATDDQGFAVAPATSVPLDQVVHAMIRFSDNAATDYLLDRIGRAAIQATISEAKLTGQEPIHSLVGTILSWQNHEQPVQDERRLMSLVALGPTGVAAELQRLHEAYLRDEWRSAEMRWRREDAPPASLSYQALAADKLAPKGTARDYARIMAGVISDTFISPEVSAIMRRHLEWPMSISGNQERFSSLGSKGGSLAGVLTEATFVNPRSGDFANRPRVVVLFMRHMPISAWIQLMETFGQQQFVIAVATERAFAEQATTALKGSQGQHSNANEASSSAP